MDTWSEAPLDQLAFACGHDELEKGKAGMRQCFAWVVLREVAGDAFRRHGKTSA